MDCAFAIQGNDYIIIASDRSVSHSIIKIQDSDDKMTLLSDNQILAACGEVSDRKNFSKLIFGELEYYYYRYNKRLDTDEVANYTRSVMAENLRKKPYQANVLVAGYDNDQAKLYWLDYLGSCSKITRGAHGYGSNFLYGIMDNYYKKDMTLENGVECTRACIFELKKRFLVSMIDFTVYLITKQGVKNVSDEFNMVMGEKK